MDDSGIVFKWYIWMNSSLEIDMISNNGYKYDEWNRYWWISIMDLIISIDNDSCNKLHLMMWKKEVWIWNQYTVISFKYIIFTFIYIFISHLSSIQLFYIISCFFYQSFAYSCIHIKIILYSTILWIDYHILNNTQTTVSYSRHPTSILKVKYIDIQFRFFCRVMCWYPLFYLSQPHIYWYRVQ